jgi:hypothetical protein
MHVPVQVNVKKVEQFVSSFFVSVTADRVKEGRYQYVTTDDGVHCPGINWDRTQDVCEIERQTILYRAK